MFAALKKLHNIVISPALPVKRITCDGFELPYSTAIADIIIQIEASVCSPLSPETPTLRENRDKAIAGTTLTRKSDLS